MLLGLGGRVGFNDPPDTPQGQILQVM